MNAYQSLKVTQAPCALLVLGVSGGIIGHAQRRDGPYHTSIPGLSPLWEDLSRNQREQIRERISELQDQGASQEHMHTAVAELLEEFGIEFPTNTEAEVPRPFLS
jgi:hypothetical protein